jgi:hypothetical protein
MKKNASGFIVLVILLSLLTGSVFLAHLVQKDFGRLEITNVMYPNVNGISIRAKLLKPREATEANPMPGIVYIHGYQNNRETGDAYSIELARRGFVVLNIDAIGRGNSGEPNDPSDTDFDNTYGGESSLNYLASLPFVRTDSLGMMGHSLGAEMAYHVALKRKEVRALVITGFAYTLAAAKDNPHNMLMIFGKWDEYRKRMTGTVDIEKEWMNTEQTRRVFPVPSPRVNETYGDFTQGTARRVFIPKAIHLQVSHSRSAIAEAVTWMRKALSPPENLWVAPESQIWPIKEWATFLALIAGLWLVMPLGSLLLQLPLFESLKGAPSDKYHCSGRAYLIHSGINGILMWLYLPLILVVFAIHIYVVKIDGIFPMMMLNAVVWWFFWINVVGFFIFRRWFRKTASSEGVTLADLGASYSDRKFSLGGVGIIQTVFLAILLAGIVYTLEHALEWLFIVDWRFIFPFANDMTPYRVKMFFLYLPFFLVGFVQTGLFLHGQIRLQPKGSPFYTWLYWSFGNITAMVVPLIIFLMVQYVPLLTTGAIPLVGPGGMFVSMVMNLFHIILILFLVIPISTWLFQLTGRIYLGALVVAMLVDWMLVSSQVIAPIPI